MTLMSCLVDCCHFLYSLTCSPVKYQQFHSNVDETKLNTKSYIPMLMKLGSIVSQYHLQ